MVYFWLRLLGGSLGFFITPGGVASSHPGIAGLGVRPSDALASDSQIRGTDLEFQKTRLNCMSK